MKTLNTLFRGMNKTTDVLSFEAAIPVKQGKHDTILGDIVISIPKAELQAEEAETGLYDEINRLLIHGILHLLGEDHEASAYRARKMRKKEEEIFLAIKKVDKKRQLCN